MPISGRGNKNIRIICDYRPISKRASAKNDGHPWNVISLMKVRLPKSMFYTIFYTVIEKSNNFEKL